MWSRGSRQFVAQVERIEEELSFVSSANYGLLQSWSESEAKMHNIKRGSLAKEVCVKLIRLEMRDGIEASEG